MLDGSCLVANSLRGFLSSPDGRVCVSQSRRGKRDVSDEQGVTLPSITPIAFMNAEPI